MARGRFGAAGGCSVALWPVTVPLTASASAPLCRSGVDCKTDASTDNAFVSLTESLAGFGGCLAWPVLPCKARTWWRETLLLNIYNGMGR